MRRGLHVDWQVGRHRVVEGDPVDGLEEVRDGLALVEAIDEEPGRLEERGEEREQQEHGTSGRAVSHIRSVTGS